MEPEGVFTGNDTQFTVDLTCMRIFDLTCMRICCYYEDVDLPSPIVKIMQSICNVLLLINIMAHIVTIDHIVLHGLWALRPCDPHNCG